MLRIALLALVMAFMGNATALSSEPAPTRIALVIGNSAYDSVSPLPNAAPDAQLIAVELRRLRFEVVERTNLSGDGLAAELAAFGQRLRAAGPEAVSFFYYAGHAAQDHQGINYLIPVDATTRTPETLRQEATPLQVIFSYINAANNPVNVVVLDACRDWYEDAPESEGVRLQGLRDMGEVANVFVALATAPGYTTQDGFGESSPYTAQLLDALRTKADQPLTLIFDDIQALVSINTDSELSPQSFNGLSRTRRWCLVDGPNCGEAASRPRAMVLTNAFLRGLDRDRLMPHTNNNVTFVDTLFSRRDLLAANGIDSQLRLAHFLRAVGMSTRSRFSSRLNSLDPNAENLVVIVDPRQPPTTDLAREIQAMALSRFSPRAFPTIELAREYVGQPERITNRIDAGRHGNGDEASGDGWRYRMRGLFATVGRANYRTASDWVGIDLLASPELVNDPEIGLALAAARWNRENMNALADADDLVSINRIMFSGGTGPGDRARLWAAKRAVGLDEPFPD